MAANQVEASERMQAAELVTPLAHAYFSRHVAPPWNAAHSSVSALVSSAKARGSYEAPRIERQLNDISTDMMMLPVAMVSAFIDGNENVGAGTRAKVSALRANISRNIYPVPQEVDSSLAALVDSLDGQRITRSIEGGEGR